METAIRWAPGPARDRHRFLLVDLLGNYITLNETYDTNGRDLQTKIVARYDRVPSFGAFDWSTKDRDLIALALPSGDTALVKIDEADESMAPLRIFPSKAQRKCNSVAFSAAGLLASGLDRVRAEHCLQIYDVQGSKDPLARLCPDEAVGSIRFFPNQPQELVASVARSSVRLFDLRSPALTAHKAVGSVNTKNIMNIAIDPLNDNSFASAGVAGDPVVSVWDKRWLASSVDGTTSAAVLDIRPAVSHVSPSTSIWSIRFSGLKRGRFCILSSDHETKLYDIATHTSIPDTPHHSSAGPAGTPWTNPSYVSKTHRMQNPYREKSPGSNEVDTIMAFDWIATGTAFDQSMLAIWPSREIGILNTPRIEKVNVTSRGDLSILRYEGVINLLEPGTLYYRELGKSQPANAAKDIGNTKIEARPRDLLAKDADLLPPPPPALNASVTAQRIASWLEPDPNPASAPTPKVKTIGDILDEENIHMQRCRGGYRFNCDHNLKIVDKDPALTKLWTIVNNFESLARDRGMITPTIDMSYLGVHSILHCMSSETNVRNFTSQPVTPTLFEAAARVLAQTRGLASAITPLAETGSKRLLCLEVCGWCFSRDGIEAKCSDLLNQSQYYRAVAIAVYQGWIDLALLILRNIARTKTIPDTGLGALLAAPGLNEEQQQMAAWMEEDATDPYLKSLLRFVRQRDWEMIARDTALDLSDRVSVAVRYLPEGQLLDVVDDITRTSVDRGDVSGILLTGLTSSCIDLFQQYISRTGDVQTAVLVTCFSAPLYVDDVRWRMWKESYLWFMQTWRTLIERTKFAVEHSRRAVTTDGERLIKPMPRQITLRCVHCNGSLAAQRDGIATNKSSMIGLNNMPAPFTAGSLRSTQSGAQEVAQASGTVCPKCGRHLPRCSICMQWLGAPDVNMVNVAGTRQAKKDGDLDGVPLRNKSKNMSELSSRFVTFCAECGHGFHAHHAEQWFAKHGMCPVPDCQCLCGLHS